MNGIEPHWLWFAAGLVLGGLEMMVPGVYLMWLALAAIATGFIVLGAGVSIPLQLVIFTVLSLVFAFSARRWLYDDPIESTDPLMNNRAARLVGQTALVTRAIEHGEGRVRVGDGEWLASGPDCPAGTRVRIAGVIGACLSVEALELAGPA